ncbi:YncE family protein [Streptomyces sp. NPDC127178]|uniref:YncE family protein n=1 Tax=unclassified Streptomyces TaxID=2593676 RepID=UPI003640B801
MTVLAGLAVPLSMAAPAVAASHSAAFAYLTNADGTVSVVNLATHDLVKAIKVGSGLMGVAVNPGHSRAYVANVGSDSVSVLDTNTNEVIKALKVGHRPEDVAVSPNGKHAYVANAGSNSMSVIDTNTNEVIKTLTVGKAPDGGAVGRWGTACASPTGARATCR